MRKYAVLLSAAALCALVLIVTGPASAVPTGVTAYTCIEGVGAANTNAHCVPKSSGKFGHEIIEVNRPMQLDLNGLGKQDLVFEDAGAEIELVAEGLECAHCMTENVLQGEEMKMSSLSAHLKYSSVVVANLAAQCQVKSPGAAVGEIESESLKIVTTSKGGVTFLPASGTAIANFELVPVTGKVCPVKGSYTLTGGWVATASGATWKTEVLLGEELVAVNGNPAELLGEVTAEALVTPTPENPSPGRHPIAFT
jgi:uncharacterized Zn-binding protein involved in type VI secretion